MRRKRVVRVIRRLWLVVGIASLVWLWQSYQAQGLDWRVLENDQAVTVTDLPTSLVFEPTASGGRTAFIFLPGAMVDPVAYAPMAHALAERGVKTIIIKLPFRMAALQSQQQDLARQIRQLIANDATINVWILGGHSRGGALAAQVVRGNPGIVDGLVLIGTSHPKAGESDLSGFDLDVTKIYATNDGLASEAEVVASQAYLPRETHWMRIEGGNHSQFGWYGFQPGDQRATITRPRQQELLIEALVAALRNVAQH